MKKRILFVEENELLLQMYVMMLEDEREKWDVSVATGGDQAMEMMGRGNFDVIASDIRSPGTSGLEFFGQVKERFPRTSRIIISGLHDQEEVARSLGSTHQFLPKPFDVRMLKSTDRKSTRLNSSHI